jgi:hypothetical protein
MVFLLAVVALSGNVEARRPASTSRVEEFSDRNEGPMRYLILIQSNERSAKLWETLTAEQQKKFGPAHRRLNKEMQAAGVLVASDGLADPATATWVSVRDGETIASDGPFAEVKEHLAGFYLIDVDGPDEAVAWAAKVPDAALLNEVEVRPVLDMSGWDL